MRLLLIFLVAFFLRLILIPNPGFEADISFWKSWGLATVDRGIVEGMKVSNNNYPTPFAYTLGAIVKVYSLFADPHNFDEFWNANNVLFLTIAKLPAILADFCIAVLIFLIAKKSPYRLWLSALYLLNPISLIDGAWWGQVDSLGVFVFLIALLLSLKRLPFWAGAVYMLSVMTKLQNMIYGPLFFLFIWQLTGPAGLTRAVTGALAGFFGLNIEFLLAREMGRVVSSLTQNFDYFPWMSLNAFNLWWIAAGAKGMQVSDKLLAIGIVNAKTVGLLLFSSFYLFALLRQLFIRAGLAKMQGQPLRNFLENLIIINAAFFLFQTQSHDRYAFPLSVFLLLWATFLKRFKLFFVFYILFTLFYSYNLHTALVLNYPLNGLPILSTFTAPFFTITTSLLLLGLFAFFIFYLVKKSNPLIYVLPISFFLLAIIWKNIPLITHTPLSLTSFTPYISEQGYGLRQTNMPVNAGLGYNSWSPLSVQYTFYRKGIGTHAPSRQAYHINGLFRRFTTDYGVDTEAGIQASAVFQIYGDDNLLFESDTMGRFDFPKHAEVDIAGVKVLTLVTTDAGDGKNDDHVDWLQSTLWP